MPLRPAAPYNTVALRETTAEHFIHHLRRIPFKLLYRPERRRTAGAETWLSFQLLLPPSCRPPTVESRTLERPNQLASYSKHFA
ncbi:hypothetical protein AOLI_G00274730 [Acnodon oligacanthus]